MGAKAEGLDDGSRRLTRLGGRRSKYAPGGVRDASGKIAPAGSPRQQAPERVPGPLSAQLSAHGAEAELAGRQAGEAKGGAGDRPPHQDVQRLTIAMPSGL
jgi:hypothetical protein